MNNASLDYLNSISTGAPSPTDKTDRLSSLLPKIFFGIIGVTLLIVIVLFIYVALTPSDSTLPSDLSRIYLRSESLSSVLNSYSGKIKSSSLRSTTSSLTSSLATLSSNTSSLLTNSFGVTKLPTVSTDLAPTDQALSADLTEHLETGRLNGVLDRTFAREMSYHTSLLIILLDAALQKLPESSPGYSALSSSRTSLSQLQTTFSSYSDASH